MAALKLNPSDPSVKGIVRPIARIEGDRTIAQALEALIREKQHIALVTAGARITDLQGQLAAAAHAAKTELAIAQADVVADGGYRKDEDVKACQEMGLEPHLPAVQNSPSERAGLYGKADFRYDPARDLYHCPNGAELTRRRQMTDKGRLLFNYDQPPACAACPVKARCTAAAFRTVSRWEHEACLERMAQKVAAAPEKLAARKTLIEHVWGTFKGLLPGGFLVRGLVKVGAEVSLAHFGYNFKRALAVVGLANLLAAWKASQPASVAVTVAAK